MIPEHVIWNNAVDRVLGSEHRTLRKHLFLGHQLESGLPLLAYGDRSSPHVWVVGSTGSGKTARLLTPQIVQRIARGTHSVVVIDPKPDKACFEACRVECFHQGIPFRYVDITPGRFTYAFRPFAQSHTRVQTMAARAESAIQAFNLDYGPVYGGSYYTAMDELFILTVFTLFPDAQTPADIARRFDNPAAIKRVVGERGWEDSSHVRAIFAKLAGTTALNVAPGGHGVTREVLDAAIDMRQPFYSQQVIYFALDAKELRTTSRATAGLAFYNLLTAAKYVGPKPAVKVTCVIDEAQEVIGSNLAVLLETSRSLGIELVLAHQNLDQLRKANQDYRQTLEENAGLQVVFNPVGEGTRDWIEATSGEQVYATINWDQKIPGGFDPRSSAAFHPRRTPRPDLLNYPRMSVGEQLGPVWDRTTLMRHSAVPGVAWMRLARDEGLFRYHGQWVPVRTLFHVPEKTYKKWMRRPWPGPNGQNVLVEHSPYHDRRFSEPPPKTPGGTKSREAVARLLEER